MKERYYLEKEEQREVALIPISTSNFYYMTFSLPVVLVILFFTCIYIKEISFFVATHI